MLPFINLLGRNLPMYGLMMTLGIVVAFLISSYRCKKAGLTIEDLLIIVACALGCALLGGGVLYLITTYSIAGLIELIKSWNTQVLFGGGLVFYGGLIFGFSGAFLGSIIAKVNLLDFLNPVIPTLPLAHAFGRLGCFCAGCCYGAPTNSPIGVVYTHPIGGAPVGISLLPTQLIEAGLNLLLFFVLLLVTRKSKSKIYPTYLYAACYAIIRFCLEFLRYDEIRGRMFGLSTSQWISIAVVVFVIFRVIMKRRSAR